MRTVKTHLDFSTVSCSFLRFLVVSPSLIIHGDDGQWNSGGSARHDATFAAGALWREQSTRAGG